MWVLVHLSVVLVACGEDGNATQDADAPREESSITLSGSVQRFSGAKCGWIPDDGSDDVDPAGKQLTIRDGRDEIVGTTETGEPSHEPSQGGCHLSTQFSVDVMPSDFYIAELEGDPDLRPTQPISHEDLGAASFNCDLVVDHGEFGDDRELAFDC
jgi:hypothetical protein